MGLTLRKSILQNINGLLDILVLTGIRISDIGMPPNRSFAGIKQTVNDNQQSFFIPVEDFIYQGICMCPFWLCRIRIMGITSA